MGVFINDMLRRRRHGDWWRRAADGRIRHGTIDEHNTYSNTHRLRGDTMKLLVTGGAGYVGSVVASICWRRATR